MSYRNVRIADQIRRELARLLREEVRDPRVGFVTLTDVDLSPDLKHARVYITTLAEDRESTMEALRRATPFLRRALARQRNLRFTPQLRFMIDESVTTGFRVEELLQEIGGEPEPEDDS
jgi:ribosome-binding factor A